MLNSGASHFKAALNAVLVCKKQYLFLKMVQPRALIVFQGNQKYISLQFIFFIDIKKALHFCFLVHEN